MNRQSFVLIILSSLLVLGTSSQFAQSAPANSDIEPSIIVHATTDVGISTCEELQLVTNSFNYYLENDVDCSDTINWNSGQGFAPLGFNSSHSQKPLTEEVFIFTIYTSIDRVL